MSFLRDAAVACFASIALAQGASAAVLYDEAASGDISTSFQGYDALIVTLLPGENEVLGTFGVTYSGGLYVVNDRDRFTFVVPDGHQLNSAFISLDNLVVTSNGDLAAKLDLQTEVLGGVFGEASPGTSSLTIRNNFSDTTLATPVELPFQGTFPQGPGTYFYDHSSSTSGSEASTGEVRISYRAVFNVTAILSPPLWH